MKQLPPDSLILVFATPWDDDATARIAETHLEIYGSHLDPTLQFEKDEPLSDLIEAARGSQPPFAETEVLALESQKVSWRFSIPNAKNSDLETVKRIAVCFSATGALAIFVPSTVRLFAPSVIRQLASSPEIDASTQLFVHAREAEGSLITRGLTAFGLPEIETTTAHGLNAAFFDLMDVAAEMLASGNRFETGDQLTLGPQLLEVTEVTATPDPLSPISGTFGQIKIGRR